MIQCPWNLAEPEGVVWAVEEEVVVLPNPNWTKHRSYDSSRSVLSVAMVAVDVVHRLADEGCWKMEVVERRSVGMVVVVVAMHWTWVDPTNVHADNMEAEAEMQTAGDWVVGILLLLMDEPMEPVVVEKVVPQIFGVDDALRMMTMLAWMVDPVAEAVVFVR
jgi:hypothetical protein